MAGVGEHRFPKTRPQVALPRGEPTCFRGLFEVSNRVLVWPIPRLILRKACGSCDFLVGNPRKRCVLFARPLPGIWPPRLE